MTGLVGLLAHACAGAVSLLLYLQIRLREHVIHQHEAACSGPCDLTY